MSLVNSPQEGYVNGTQGTVTDASADAVTVKFDGVDEKVRIERHRWEINKSEAVVEMDDEGRPVNRVKTAVVGTYTQIPLKLAYAITIHKSQGLTFDACCVHTKVFAEGQLYVGLSRVRSAAGLTVFPKIEPNRLIASREVVEFYDSLERRMEEPVQIECPRRFESQVRAYIRDLMDGPTSRRSSRRLLTPGARSRWTGTLRRLPCTRRATGPSTRARLTLRCS